MVILQMSNDFLVTFVDRVCLDALVDQFVGVTFEQQKRVFFISILFIDVKCFVCALKRNSGF